jgi:hypothetical protein
MCAVVHFKACLSMIALLDWEPTLLKMAAFRKGNMLMVNYMVQLMNSVILNTILGHSHDNVHLLHDL